MREIIQSCAYFGVFLTLAAYFAGAAIRKKTGLSLFNPLMIAIVLILYHTPCRKSAAAAFQAPA